LRRAVSSLTNRQRPDIFRADGQYELHYRPVMTSEAFIELNQSACKSLQSENPPGVMPGCLSFGGGKN
jgi:hypothetical protein